MSSHLSFSQVSLLRRCGEAYRLQRVWKVPEVPSWAQVGGGAVHSQTEAQDLHTLGGDPPKDFAFYMEEATAAQSERSGVDPKDFKATGRATKANPDKEDRKWWLANGPAMCQRWTNWRAAAPLDIWISETGVPGIEIEFKVRLGEADVLGYIDRVMVDHRTGQLVVIDLKSGARKVAGDGQLGIYKIGLWETFGAHLDIRYGAYWYAREGATGELLPLNEWSVERATWEYEAALKRRARGDFQPNVADHCGWCGVRDFCYAANGSRVGEIRPPWVSVDEWESEAA